MYQIERRQIARNYTDPFCGTEFLPDHSINTRPSRGCEGAGPKSHAGFTGIIRSYSRCEWSRWSEAASDGARLAATANDSCELWAVRPLGL